jgi:hypothetical protein
MFCFASKSWHANLILLGQQFSDPWGCKFWFVLKGHRVQFSQKHIYCLREHIPL